MSSVFRILGSICLDMLIHDVEFPNMLLNTTGGLWFSGSLLMSNSEEAGAGRPQGVVSGYRNRVKPCETPVCCEFFSSRNGVKENYIPKNMFGSKACVLDAQIGFTCWDPKDYMNDHQKKIPLLWDWQPGKDLETLPQLETLQPLHVVPRCRSTMMTFQENSYSSWSFWSCSMIFSVFLRGNPSTSMYFVNANEQLGLGSRGQWYWKYIMIHLGPWWVFMTVQKKVFHRMVPTYWIASTPFDVYQLLILIDRSSNSTFRADGSLISLMFVLTCNNFLWQHMILAYIIKPAMSCMPTIKG